MSRNQGRSDPLRSSSPTKHPQAPSLSHHLPSHYASDPITPRLRLLSRLTKTLQSELRECAEDAEEAGLGEHVQEMDEAWKESWQEIEAMEERKELFEGATTDVEGTLQRMQVVQAIPVGKANWARNQQYVTFRQDIWVPFTLLSFPV